MAIAIDENTGMVTSSYPAGEAPGFVIDGDPLAGDPPMPQRTKYLNFSGMGTGFIVSPILPLAVESFQFRTGNDAPGRDPATWELYGFNGPLVSTDNSRGDAEAWALIGSGSTGLNADPALDLRSSLLAPVDVPANPGYEHYKMVFPTLRGGAGQLFQMGEIQFYDADNGGGNPILAPGDPILAINSRVGDPINTSSFPAGEHPGLALDINAGTKYLNFGEENSGLIITNAEGPVRVNYMRITTANDEEARDPTSYRLYGTNDPIESDQNSTGMGGEVWTLISEGALSLPSERFTNGPVVEINSPADYESYKLVFPTVKDAAATNSMQIADVQFATDINQIPEPSAIVIAMMGLMMVAATRRRHC